MIRNKPLAAEEFLKRAASVASYYGFSPLESKLKNAPAAEQKKRRQEIPQTSDCFSEEIRTILERTQLSALPETQNQMQLYHVHTREPRKKRQPTGTRFCLSVFGIEQSVAEALVLRSTLAILDEVGVQNVQVRINSVGDRDSMQRFLREFNAYLRKNLADMPTPCREALKRDTFEALVYLSERAHPLLDHAPRPMQFLTDASRRHLKEIIEFLELTHIPYELDTELVGNRDYYSQTVFEVKEITDDEPGAVYSGMYARGGRCDDLIKKLFRTQLPMVSVVIEQPLKKAERISWKPPRNRIPKIYFVHFGARAKLLSLSIVETLRKVHIPLQQAIGNESLSAQLEEARVLKIPFALIIGQREALDGTAIIRDMHTHAQTIVPIDELPKLLKTK